MLKRDAGGGVWRNAAEKGLGSRAALGGLLEVSCGRMAAKGRLLNKGC